VAVGSLSGVGPANGTCIGISGINIGSGCASTFGNFALGLGQGTVANSSGGFLNGAIAVGTNVAAFAGSPAALSVANLALNIGSADNTVNPTTGAPNGPAFSRVTAGPGFLNLGANFGGNASPNPNGPQPMVITAAGFGSSALNFIGNRNRLTSVGILNNTTNAGNPFGFPNGSDSVLTSTGNFSTAFNYQGFLSPACDSLCGNTVVAQGPGAIAGAINVVKQIVVQQGPGITLRTPFDPNTGGSTASTFAAPTTFAGGSSNKSGNQLSGSLTKGSKQFSSSLKKLGDGVKNALSGLGKKKQTSTPDKTSAE